MPSKNFVGEKTYFTQAKAIQHTKYEIVIRTSDKKYSIGPERYHIELIWLKSR